MCDKTVSLLHFRDGFVLLGGLPAEPFPWASANVKWSVPLQGEHMKGKQKRGIEMTDDGAREEGRGEERMCEGCRDGLVSAQHWLAHLR